MSPVRRFLSEDIGVELFPAITSGLYKDPLDALREYIQNAIDANATKVDIKITKDLVSIKDNGSGMTPEQANKAIRLGISEKNPAYQVGFRGIGIYSSFDLCDVLEIRTRTGLDSLASKIRIDFGAIRSILADEETRRKSGEPPKLHLQLMLSQAVVVEDDDNPPFDGAGTLVILVGLLGSVFQRLNNIHQVKTYLQNVVPLPFNPTFEYREIIESKFKKEDYKVVNVDLNINGNQEPLYRPYINGIFEHGGKYPPQIFSVVSPDTNKKYGFAWVCINDARKVLKDKEFRGLLVKKLGFSVSDRDYLEPIFSRTVFSRRITGEVIVRHRDLIPNAARTDFESNATRADFQIALNHLVQEISTWADKIQSQLKAFEEIDEIAPTVVQIYSDLPTFRRDVEKLLELNIELSDIRRRLQSHRKVLQAERAGEFAEINTLLDEAQSILREYLAKKPRTSTRASKQVLSALRAEMNAPAEEATTHREDRPRTIIETLESLDIVVTEPVKLAVSYIDENLIRSHLSKEQYAKEIETMRDYLEELV